MKLTILTFATAALIAASPVAFAQGAAGEAPGHQQPKNYKGSPGASYYAPGQKMLRDRAKGKDTKGPGASYYAPGRSTTGSGSNNTTTRSR